MDARAETLAGEGKAELEKGNTYGALSCFEAALHYDSSSDVLWLYHGMCLHKSGNFEEAIASYDRAIGVNAENINALVNKAICLSELDRYAEAVQCSDVANRVFPGLYLVWAIRADCLRLMKEYEEALASYEKFLELKPEDENALVNKGVCLLELGRYPEAVRWIDQTLAIFPEEPLSWYNRGTSLFHLCEYEDAISSLNRAIELKPHYAIAWNNKGNCLMRLGRTREALSCFDEAIGIDPSLLNAHANKGRCCTMLGLKGLVRECEQILLAFPARTPDEWCFKASCLETMRSHIHALAAIEHALREEPLNLKFLYQKAYCLVKLGNGRDASACFLRIRDAITRMSSQGNPSRIRYIPDHDFMEHHGFRILQEHFLVIEELGQGGFGSVSLVFDLVSETVCAIKTFRNELFYNRSVRERFRNEAQVWINLGTHENILHAHRVFSVEDRFYILMDYIEPDDNGRTTLQDHLRTGLPSLSRSIEWAIQFCHGMEHAFSRGLVCHRDIKPSNILIDRDGTVKISDFGLAKIADTSNGRIPSGGTRGSSAVGASPSTQTGCGLGTLLYMSPEHFNEPSGCDQRSDIYSFGIVLSQMANRGIPPFMEHIGRPGYPKQELEFWRWMHERVTPVPIPSPLNLVVGKCLKKDPAERYQSFSELEIDLLAILDRVSGQSIQTDESADNRDEDWGRQAAALFALGKWKEALQWFERGDALLPGKPATLMSIGECYAMMGDTDHAMAFFNRSLEIDPDYAEAWDNKGNCFIQLQQLDEALECYRKAISLNPLLWQAWNNMGLVLEKQNRIEEALHCFDRVIQINQQMSMVHVNKAMTLMKAGRHGEALACCDEGLKKNPLYADLWAAKAAASMLLQRPEDARKFHEEAIRIRNAGSEQKGPVDGLKWVH